MGASGGILVIWNSFVFLGRLVQVKRFGVIVSFTSVNNSERWTLVTIYGPCDGALRDDFVSWLYHLDMPLDEQWLLLGDFNFMHFWRTEICRVMIRMMFFCLMKLLATLGCLSCREKGRAYTWSNL